MDQNRSSLSATRNDTLDMTFVWEAKKDDKVQPALKVSVDYGWAGKLDNNLEVSIPWGQTEPMGIGPGKNPGIQVQGNLTVQWGKSALPGTGPYIVTFRGVMVRGGVNNIVSDSSAMPPIIVSACLDA